MARYVNWDDVVGRYPGIASIGGADQVGSDYIQYAEVEIEGRLAERYTVPFSDNNLTIRDLVIDLVYVKAGNLSVEDYEQMADRLDKRIERLLEGREAMVTTSGDIIQRADEGAAWSSTQDYAPTFGVGDVLDMHPDDTQIEDENDARK